MYDVSRESPLNDFMVGFLFRFTCVALFTCFFLLLLWLRFVSLPGAMESFRLLGCVFLVCAGVHHLCLRPPDLRLSVGSAQAGNCPEFALLDF